MCDSRELKNFYSHNTIIIITYPPSVSVFTCWCERRGCFISLIFRDCSCKHGSHVYYRHNIGLGFSEVDHCRSIRICWIFLSFLWLQPCSSSTTVPSLTYVYAAPKITFSEESVQLQWKFWSHSLTDAVSQICDIQYFVVGDFYNYNFWFDDAAGQTADINNKLELDDGVRAVCLCRFWLLTERMNYKRHERDSFKERISFNSTKDLPRPRLHQKHLGCPFTVNCKLSVPETGLWSLDLLNLLVLTP